MTGLGWLAGWFAGDGPTRAAWALAVLAAKATLLVAFGAAAAPLVGRRSAAARHLVWAATLAGVLALPVLHLTGPRWTPRPLRVVAESLANAAVAGPPTAGPEAVPSDPAAPRQVRAGRALAPGVVAGGVVLVWGVGVGAGLAAAIAGALARGRFARGRYSRGRYSRRPASDAGTADAGTAVRDALHALGARIGVRRPVRLAWGPAGTMPMTWGVWRPVVRLPADAVAWPAAARDAVLRHELAHVRRGDAGWAMVAELAGALFWCHPGVWVARAARVRWQERAADALAVETGAERHAYAAALVHAARLLVRASRPARHPSFAAALSTRVGLAERLHTLTAPDFAPGPCARARQACVLVGMAAGAVTVAALGRASAMPRVANAGTAATATTSGDAPGRRPGRAFTGTGGQPMTSGNPSGAEAGALPLTDDARRLLLEARDESDWLHHEYLGIEHLVLALAHRAGDAAPLSQLGVDGEQVRRTLATVVGPADSARALATGAARPYTTRTRAVLTLAAESARAHGHSQVGTGHVLVGIMREGQGIGAQVLGHHGLTLEAAEAYVRRLGPGHGPP